MAVVGTVFSAKAKKEGYTASRKFFVIEIMEIVDYSLGMIGMIASVLITIIAASR